MMSETLLLYRGENFNPNFYYHSGLDVSHAFLIIKNRKKTIVTNELNRGLGGGFRGRYTVSTDMIKSVKKLVKRADMDGRMPVHLYLKLADRVKMNDKTEDFYRIRMMKNSDEISNIKKAVRATKEIIESVKIKEGKKEKDIAGEILAETYRRGFEPAFEPIVTTGRNASTPHAISTDKRIADYVLVDYGVRYKHYCGDITRCFFFKTKKAQRVREIYEKLKRLSYDIIDAGKDVRYSSEVRKFYEALNKRYNLPKPIHSIGHGIGLEVHEYPRFGRNYKDRITKTTFTIEPGAYLKDFGVRYEETVFHNGKRIVVL